ncbi:isoleucine--tRNA ligase [Roseofilum casamattae]|uniref:Isoleucine--tRNA ligase n=1 Tax=Roseofilum casamattae BLCC-M143 TaxID=3022442 RepID=A0ABT7BR38_9CYAN|nr:isoleucine--tRNA ligase [Roseofilum casamattae]MDJ1181659.1 isoleucine--tRNA ligase [Roseofilum casamattae BLCC-M143]
MTAEQDYKTTVNLPKTSFEMRANSTQKEPELQAFWRDRQIYEKLSQENPGELFVLHDGPPYANGSLHMGHALNKILKDIINKYKLLQGHKVRYVPGWDCHGLPIELKVLQAMKSEERKKLTPITLRQKAAEFAQQTVEEQREGFKRYGIWGDWDRPYMTLEPEYEAAQIEVFGQMALKGYIYRGLKAVHWSPSSRTALAEAELEYPEGHTSDSIYAAFRIAHINDEAFPALGEYRADLGVAIWTTTPWTIPANLAVAVNPDLTYAVVDTGRKKTAKKKASKGFAGGSDRAESSSPKGVLPKYLLVAEEAIARLNDVWNTTLTLKAKIKGRDLEHCTYKHPLFNRESPIVIGGDYVTTESGTGLVHTAPGHGQEDFIVGQRYGLPVLSPVNEAGCFTKLAGRFEGLNVLKDANPAIIEALTEAGSLLKQEPYTHKYPYDWRTKKPTIFRATEQWFASVDKFRDEAMAAIAEVEWIPGTGENRISAMVSERSDWCISRQRSWGVPIPVFYDEETREPLLTEETIAHVKGIIAEHGSDAWWTMPVEELLPESYRNNGKTYRKGQDTMDVWFDSGSSWSGVANAREELKYPVDLYLEGSDQHRGWFQSSLLTSVATNGVAPYKTVLTHGFALDEQGRKMSKSLGNVVDPRDIINGGNNKKQDPAYGADVLRLWVSSVDYSSDVPIGKTILRQLSDVYRKIRNTSRFLLGNLYDFVPDRDRIPYEELPELDRYMLHRMGEVFAEITDAFENYQFFRFFQTVQNFCVVDLSNFYLDIAKDRLYISSENGKRRRSCQTVLSIAVENLARAIAPVLSHMAEDIWQNLPYDTPHESVFQAGWITTEPYWHNPPLAEKWTKLRQIRTEVNKVLESARTAKAIGSALEAKVLLYVGDRETRDILEQFNPALSVALKSEKPEMEERKVEEVEGNAPSAPKSESSPATPGSFAELLAVPQQWLQRGQVLVKDYPRAFLTLSTLLGGAVTLNVAWTTSQSMLRLPILSLLLELVGVGYAAWFVAKRLVPAAERSVVLKQANTWFCEFIGEDTVLASETAEPSVESAPAPSKPVSAPPATGGVGNGVDELRYLLITSQVELVDSPKALEGIEYSSSSDGLGVAVVAADGEKCDRCWNYSTHVGTSSNHPTLCERCVSALDGEF